jgi:hypothetical protein
MAARGHGGKVTRGHEESLAARRLRGSVDQRDTALIGKLETG